MAMGKHFPGESEPARRRQIQGDEDVFAKGKGRAEKKHPAERHVMAHADQRSLAAVHLHRSVAPGAAGPSARGVALHSRLGCRAREGDVKRGGWNVERKLIHEKKAR